MPGRDGTGPAYGGKGAGKRGGLGLGPGGKCICPSCGKTLPHTTKNPCYQISCPNCGTRMTRKK